MTQMKELNIKFESLDAGKEVCFFFRKFNHIKSCFKINPEKNDERS